MTAALTEHLAAHIGSEFEGQLVLGGLGSDLLLPNLHPLAHGHLLLQLRVEAGCIASLRFFSGVQHRGDEKLLENRDYRQGLSLINRNNWLMPVACELAYAQACESLMGLRVPERAVALRELTLTLSRLAAEFTMHIARQQLRDLAIREAVAQRESVLTAIEVLTGARIHTSYFRLGGVARDIDDNAVSAIAALDGAVVEPQLQTHLAAVKSALASVVATDGPTDVTLPKVVRVPVGNDFKEVASITGAVGVWLHSDGGKSPQRVAMSAPSSLALAQLEHAAVGMTFHQLLDDLLNRPLCPGEIAR